MDTHADKFIESSSVGKHVFDIVTRYEQQGLPTQEEFHEIQKRLNIEHMGVDEMKDPLEVRPTRSINIWDHTLFEEDESLKVLL